MNAVKKMIKTIIDTPEWAEALANAYEIEQHFCFAPEYYYHEVYKDKVLFSVDENYISLFEINHPIFGHYLTTAPFGSMGGVSVDNEEVLDKLIGRAKNIAQSLDVDYLCIRSDCEIKDLIPDYSYLTFEIDLSRDLWKQFNSKTRNQIHKGNSFDFELCQGVKYLDQFVFVYQRHMRDLGSPAHGKGFFSNVVGSCRDFIKIYVVMDKDKPIAGSLNFRVGKVESNLMTVSLKKYNPSCANYKLYWHMIQESKAEGYEIFDMGRSLVNSGNSHFKENWATKRYRLYYNYYLRKSSKIPNVNLSNLNYSRLSKIWKRLPLFVANSIGPHLIRGIA